MSVKGKRGGGGGGGGGGGSKGHSNFFFFLLSKSDDNLTIGWLVQKGPVRGPGGRCGSGSVKMGIKLPKRGKNYPYPV